MTALKHQHHSHLKVIKGGKYPHKKFSKKSRYYFRKREKKRKACIEQKNIFFAEACVNTLRLMQRVARYLNPAFYYERQVPHYETLRSTIINSLESEEYSINIIEKELCIYKSFAHMKPQRLQDYCKVLLAGEDEFKLKHQEREENYFDKESGLRLTAKYLILYVATSQMEFFVEINELLLQYKDEKLIQLFYNITIHIQFLNTHNNEQ
jgi:hypothetical protein